MSLPTAELQTAWIARYRGDATLQGLMIGASTPTWNIYDSGGVPTLVSFPYVVVTPITAQTGTALAMGMDAVDVYMQVQCFTQGHGFSQSRAIMKQIYALTHEYSFTLTGGFVNFFTLFQSENEAMQPDGISQGITQRYRTMNQG